MLKALSRAVLTHEQELYSALRSDLNKSEGEAYLTELSMVMSELKTARDKLLSWQKPKHAKTPISHFPAKSRIYREPYGCVLILSPWNYPVQLLLLPLIGAIAGGNCAILKPSKSSPAVSRLISELIAKTFPADYIAAIGPDESLSYDEILAIPYDLIFFTGSERVGKIVMEKAAKHLTPVVLELGGKSPCIIEKTADIKLAAKRIAWGKLLNAGQTCVAPDYLLVASQIKEEFINALKLELCNFHDDAIQNNTYPKIINRHHFDRLKAYIDKTPDKLFCESDTVANEKKAFDEATLKIPPIIFPNASFSDPVMQEEIFGPILPIISFSKIDDIIKEIKSRPRPLALYLFTQNKSVINQVITELSFGGGCINDVIMQIANHFLPFGGVSQSGMGSYHGKWSFNTFTREKSVLIGKRAPDIPLRYPPYTKKKLNLIKKFMP